MQCGNKSRLTESDAWRLARKLIAKGDAVHAYRCKECGGSWHVGHDRKLSARFRAGAEG